MPKVHITKPFINRIKCSSNKRKEVYSDTKETGLILEVKNTGTKTYYYRYRESNTTKQKKLASANAITIDEARELVKEFKIDKERTLTIGIHTNKENNLRTITLHQFWNEHYLPHIQVTTKAYKTQESFYRLYIKPYFGDLLMDTITSGSLSKHQADLIGKFKLAKNTSNKFITILSSIYNKAILWNIEGITINPVKKLKVFQVDSSIEVYLNKEQIGKLLEVADNHINNINLASIIRFLLFTGARRGEVLKAKWQDIDLDNNIWTIPLSKSNKVRKIPISKSLRELIISLPTNNTIYIFPSPITNKPMRCIYKHWNKVRKKANLEYVRLHDLRHSMASMLVNSGVSIYHVQNILGHSSIKMTMRYAHLSNQALQDAVGVMDGVIS